MPASEIRPCGLDTSLVPGLIGGPVRAAGQGPGPDMGAGCVWGSLAVDGHGMGEKGKEIEQVPGQIVQAAEKKAATLLITSGQGLTGELVTQVDEAVDLLLHTNDSNHGAALIRPSARGQDGGGKATQPTGQTIGTLLQPALPKAEGGQAVLYHRAVWPDLAAQGAAQFIVQPPELLVDDKVVRGNGPGIFGLNGRHGEVLLDVHLYFLKRRIAQLVGQIAAEVSFFLDLTCRIEITI